jgi:hypothetical protein
MLKKFNTRVRFFAASAARGCVEGIASTGAKEIPQAPVSVAQIQNEVFPASPRNHALVPPSPEILSLFRAEVMPKYVSQISAFTLEIPA